MKRKNLYLLFFQILLACRANEPDNQTWIQNEITAYLKESDHPVSTLYMESDFEQHAFKVEDIVVQGHSCVQYQLDLLAKGDDENGNHTIVSTSIALDTVAHQVFETDFETGEFILRR